MNKAGAVDPVALSRAEEVVRYYQRLADDDERKWALRLFMAKAWIKLMRDHEEDLSDIKSFQAALESQRHEQGSMWVELCAQVKQWLDVAEPSVNHYYNFK